MFFFISRYIFIVHWPRATRRKMSFDLFCNADCLLCFPYLLFHAFTTRYRSAHSIFFFVFNFNSSLALSLCVYKLYMERTRISPANICKHFYSPPLFLHLNACAAFIQIHSNQQTLVAPLVSLLFDSLLRHSYNIRQSMVVSHFLHVTLVECVGPFAFTFLHLQSHHLINHTIPSIFNAISIQRSIVFFSRDHDQSRHLTVLFSDRFNMHQI